MEHAINITKTIDSDLVNDVIDTAGYSIGYWATSAVVDDENETYTLTWDGSDFKDDDPKAIGNAVVDYRHIAIAIGKIANMDVDVAGFIYDSIHLWLSGKDCLDGDLADVIIQIALFGEIIYG